MNTKKWELKFHYTVTTTVSHDKYGIEYDSAGDHEPAYSCIIFSRLFQYDTVLEQTLNIT